jgi:putative endonuclease
MPSSKNPRRQRNRVSIGRRFEKLAADYFRQQGYEILDHHWQAGRKEIDLVVKKGALLAFVEVKSASSRKFGHPAERVDRRKISNLTQAAQKYVADKSITGCDLRFDVVSFVDGVLEHFPGAFEALDEA